MTFIISPGGVKNTKGTVAKINGGGRVNIEGSFENSGQVNIDIRANLNVVGRVINSGNFNIQDYITQEKLSLIDAAIRDLGGEPKQYLRKSYEYLKSGDNEQADRWFRRFYSYIAKHPELVVGSVQILLQLFSQEIDSM
jgi:hypothetical protein